MKDKEITRRKIETATHPKQPSDYRDHYYPKTEILGEKGLAVGLAVGPMKAFFNSARQTITEAQDNFKFYPIFLIQGYAGTLVIMRTDVTKFNECIARIFNE